MTRIACLLIPDLALRAALRAEPELEEVPLVITSGPSGVASARAEILCASQQAEQAGIQPGMTLREARAFEGDLVTRTASPALDQAARETLLDLAFSVSPRAEGAPRGSGVFVSEGVVFAEASGFESLYPETTFASIFRERAAKAGLPGYVAIASSRVLARLAARRLAYWPKQAPEARGDAEDDATLLVLAPADEARFLSPLPIDLLDPDDETAESLTRFGIHRMGELLRLPRRDLAARLGPGVLSLVALARGEVDERPLPEPKSDRLEEGLDLEDPVSNLEALAFVLRGLTSRLTERLQLRALGCAQLDLEWRLEDGARARRRVGLAAPTQDERVLLRLLRLAIEAEPPAAPIESLTLLAKGRPLSREQLDFFLPRGPSPNALEHTLAELCALCGAQRVGQGALSEDHRPGGFTLQPFQPKRAATGSARSKTSSRASPRVSPRASARTSSRTSLRAQAALRDRKQPSHDDQLPPQNPAQPRLATPLGLRAIRPPLRAEVRLRRGRPASLRSTLSTGTIRRAAGPWRTTGLWWSTSSHFALDHYDIQMQDGSLLRLCFDWKAKRWQIDGLYD